MRMAMLGLGLVLVLVGTVYADEVKSETSVGFGALGGPFVGVQMFDTSGINDYLSPAGADELGNVLPMIGLELHGVAFDRAIFGVTGAFGQQSRDGSDLRVDMTTGWVTLDAGFLAFERGGFRGYPMLGLGASQTYLDLDGDSTALPLATQAGVEYKSVDDDSGRVGPFSARRMFATKTDLSLQYAALIARLALHVDRHFPVYESSHGSAFVFTGVRAGVTIDAANRGWTLDGDSLDGPEPDFRYDSAFLQLAFGFGGGAPSGHVMHMHEQMHDRMMRMIEPEKDGSAHDHGAGAADGDKESGDSRDDGDEEK